jgi:hypothetical protein
MNQSEPVHNCTFHIAFSSLPRPKALKWEKNAILRQGVKIVIMIKLLTQMWCSLQQILVRTIFRCQVQNILYQNPRSRCLSRAIRDHLRAAAECSKAVIRLCTQIIVAGDLFACRWLSWVVFTNLKSLLQWHMVENQPWAANRIWYRSSKTFKF